MPNNEVQDYQINDLFKKHNELQEGYNKVSRTVTEIKDNHLAHIAVDLATTKTNVDWLLRYHWIITGAAIGAFIASVINLIAK